MKLKNKKQSSVNYGFNRHSTFAMRKLSAGFTIIELLVVFSISALIATVMIASYPDYGRNIEFENAVLDVALVIREAQVYGFGAKGSAGGDFSGAYGVYFSGRDKRSILLFRDANDDNKYDSDGSDETIDSFSINSDFEISSLCAKPQSGSQGCAGQFGGLSIVFKRPNPDAVITLSSVSRNYSGIWAKIKIKNTKTDKTKTIKVTEGGQISVQ